MRLNLAPLFHAGFDLNQLRCSKTVLGVAAIASLLWLGLTAQAAASAEGVRSGMPISAAVLESAESGQPIVASGIYLFGEAQESGQLGHEYMVFQVLEDRMVGAFFRPSSDFSCFTGRIENDVMYLAVEEPDLQGSSSFSVQLYLSNQIAATTTEILFPFEGTLGLQGTYRIPEVDRTSRMILDTCKADLGL